MIYLDSNASTKLDPEVRAAMGEAAELYGNPSSLHGEGRRARRAVEEARAEVAQLVGAEPDEIFFSSGGTEANAMAVSGARLLAGGAAAGSTAVVRSGAEHPSVREPADARGGGKVIDPDPSGALDAGKVLAAIEPGTCLVTVMAANNEYGALFPVGEIAAGVRRRNMPGARILVHTDAVQAAGRVALDVRELGVDLLTLSAHKIHGPKGAGALFIRRGVPLPPRTAGGGQEKGLRGGTENTPAIVGFGAAARLSRLRLEAGEDGPRIEGLRDRLEQGILEAIPGTRPLGAAVSRLNNTSAILFDGAAAETLLIRLDLEGVAVSAGSACSSGTLAPSPAILSLGLSRHEARQVLRFSLSRLTTPGEIEAVLKLLPGAVGAVRAKGAVSAVRTEGPASAVRTKTAVSAVQAASPIQDACLTTSLEGEASVR